jgi:transcriptional regulator EpsA
MSPELLNGREEAEHQENRRVQAIVHAIECAVKVHRRYQFFFWTQDSIQVILPHQLAICGYYDRARKEVRLEALNSIVVPAPVLAMLTDGRSLLMQHVITAWINNRGHALAVHLPALAQRGTSLASSAELLTAAGFVDLLVHGVSRPQRSADIETLFVFASPGAAVTKSQVASIELLLPNLHSTYLRVQAIEREIAEAGSQPCNTAPGFSGTSISEREEQVLAWVREGMSNQEIGEQLGISPLTVKNHIQKILRKLGAANRTQAVARAISMNLLVGGGATEPRRFRK